MTTEIEKTNRQMYADLKRFESMVGSTHLFKNLQDSLEAHLEELRKANSGLAEMFVKEKADVEVRLANMTEERNQIQQRLHAIDHAYNEQQKAIGIAGEELIRVQGIARQHLDDCRSAEKMTDDLYEKLGHTTTVIGQQEQLIVGQRLAIADLYISGRRVNSAVATLQRLGYTDCGGQLWKPPIGQAPRLHDGCIDPLCAKCKAHPAGGGSGAEIRVGFGGASAAVGYGVSSSGCTGISR